MKLYTQVKFPKLPHAINFDTRMLMIGSCFTENIGQWLAKRKFIVAINPLGISYNPISIASQLDIALNGLPVDTKHIVCFDEQYFHLDAHSSIHASNANELQKCLTERYSLLRNELQSAQYLFLTFGSSWVFRSIHSNQVVNNCHRQAESNFNRELLSLEEMKEIWTAIIRKLQLINPGLKLVISVSPIRHLRHGAIDNNRSKARLLLFSEWLSNYQDNIIYLPIYELVMDELRDYRFYRHDDMVHLNELGLAMVIERFRDECIDEKAKGTLDEIEAWLLMKNHSLNKLESPSQQAFKEKFKDKTNKLNAILPNRFKSDLN